MTICDCVAKIRNDVETNIFNKADETVILLLHQNTILEEIRDILKKGELNARPEPKRQYTRRRKPAKPKRKPFTARPGWKPPGMDTGGTEIGENASQV
jgi:hypothetical protein